MHMLVRLSICGIVALLGAAAVCRHVWITSKVADASGVSRSTRVPDTFAQDQNRRAQVLLLGDSRLSRWHQEGSGSRNILNRALGGETVAQLARRFPDEIQRFQPTQVVVSSGINDVVGLSFMPRADAAVLLSTLLKSYATFADLTEQAGIRLIITTIIPPSRPTMIRRFVWPSQTIDLVRDINQSLRKHGWPANTMLLDFDLALPLDADGYLSKEYSLDTLHLNQHGYNRFGALILNALDH